MSHDKDKEKKPHVDPQTLPPIPPPPPPVNLPYEITRVYAEGGDGPAIVVTATDPEWQTGFVVIITALQITGLIVLNHPYQVVRVNPFTEDIGKYMLKEEDEDGDVYVSWNNNANGDGANPGTIVLR